VNRDALEKADEGASCPPILLIMGVSGSGKTTVALILAKRLGWHFEEGDALHPEANIAKMKAGIPLTDEDRQPWLVRVAAWIDRQCESNAPGIITCSALKRSYRQIVIGARTQVRLVYLHGAREVLAERVANRHGHFMPASLLDSQIATLEEPGPDEHPLTVDIGPPADKIADEIVRRLEVAGGA
jgi:ribose 5-phosphate isomerase A